MDGLGALQEVAPAPAQALADIEAVLWHDAAAAGITDALALAAQVCAAQLGLPALQPPATSAPALPPSGDWRDLEPLAEPLPTALRFAEQFSCDVSAIDDGLRGEVIGAFGAAVGTYVQGLYVVDFLPRVRAALDGFFGTSAWPGPGAATFDGDLWAAMDVLIRSVPQLTALDPVTSELVRLRGARQHQCRICQSIRSRPALLAGANDDVFAAVDTYESSDLPADQRAALSFTDAMIWSPGRIEPSTYDAVSEHFAPEARVELILDIARNALNKVAVAMKADDPHVTEGYEIYDIEPNGDLVYGLSLT
jgi:alkylhydroperoxidase family enzyme